MFRNLIPTIKYAKLTVKHKWFVFLAGIDLEVPLWRLIIHDWSKFTPSELSHYGRQFFGDKSDPQGFAKAWLHHQNHNPHHWEYWITRSPHCKERGNGRYAIAQTVKNGNTFNVTVVDVMSDFKITIRCEEYGGICKTSDIIQLVNRLNGGGGALEMPEQFVAEMVADWQAAGRAYEGKWPEKGKWAWLHMNDTKVTTSMHPKSVDKLNKILKEHGYGDDIPKELKCQN